MNVLGKFGKRLLSLIVTMLVVTSLVGCMGNKGTSNEQGNNNEGNDSTHYPITITNYDANGKEVSITFDKAPEKVITTNQTTTELMLDLGLEDKLIGTAYLDNPILNSLKDKYDKIPVISDKYPTKEQVLALQPDLIFGWKSVFADKTLGNVNEWTDRGINTFVQRNTVKELGDYTVENLFKDIDDLGLIFNIKEKTDKYVSNLKTRLSDIEKKTNKVESKPRVLILGDKKENEFRLYGKNDLVADMVKRAGGEVVGEKSGSLSLENLVAENPDAIVFVHYGDDKDIYNSDIAKTFTENKALQSINAVKENKIIIAGLAETWAGGVRVVDAIERYAEGLHPEIFK